MDGPKGYFILEQDDCENYLTKTESNILWQIQLKILASRKLEGKKMGNYLVFDRDNPDYKKIEELFHELEKVYEISNEETISGEE